jgi:acetolactate synthase-1/2/3 large subunit
MLGLSQDAKAIKPQYAVERLYELTKGPDTFITTEVGQHQMWAAQYYRFEDPNRWMTSGGLGTMGYGIPAAVGVQVANPKGLVIDIAGEASAHDDHAGIIDGGAISLADQNFHPE